MNEGGLPREGSKSEDTRDRANEMEQGLEQASRAGSRELCWVCVYVSREADIMTPMSTPRLESIAMRIGDVVWMWEDSHNPPVFCTRIVSITRIFPCMVLHYGSQIQLIFQVSLWNPSRGGLLSWFNYLTPPHSIDLCIQMLGIWRHCTSGIWKVKLPWMLCASFTNTHMHPYLLGRFSLLGQLVTRGLSSDQKCSCF